MGCSNAAIVAGLVSVLVLALLHCHMVNRDLTAELETQRAALESHSDERWQREHDISENFRLKGAREDEEEEKSALRTDAREKMLQEAQAMRVKAVEVADAIVRGDSPDLPADESDSQPNGPSLAFAPGPKESCYPGKDPSECTVCVIMPFCSKTDAMSNALDSILTQTHKNWELMLVLNNVNNSCPWSMSQTRDFLNTRVPAELRPKIKLLQTRNSITKKPFAGLGRNVGLRACTSELVAFLDDDDMSLTDRLETQVKLLYEKHALMVTSDMYMLARGARFPGRFYTYTFKPLNTTREACEWARFRTYDWFTLNRFDQRRADSYTDRYRRIDPHATVTWFTHEENNITRIDPRALLLSNVLITSSVLMNMSIIREKQLTHNEHMAKQQDYDFWRKVVRADNYQRPIYHSAIPTGIYDGFEHGKPLKEGSRPNGYRGAVVKNNPKPKPKT